MARASKANVEPTQEAMDDAIKCMAYGHQWDRVSGLQREAGAGHTGYRITFRCMRCASERLWTCDINGVRYYTSYEYSTAFEQAARPDVDESYTRKESLVAMALSTERRAHRASGTTIPTVLPRRTRAGANKSKRKAG